MSAATVRRINVSEYVAQRLLGLTARPVIPSPDEVHGAPVVGTHDGTFHCDEALACGLLRHTTQFAGCAVTRTRQPDVLAKCVAIVDVGGVFNVDTLRFDHHQPEFHGTMNTGLKQYATRLSSAGLVYETYGREILKKYLETCVEQGAVRSADLPGGITEDIITLLFDQLYTFFIEHIDGIDNGVDEFGAGDGVQLVRRYGVSSTLSARIGRLYPRWNEVQTRADEDNMFIKAVQLATTEFFEALDHVVCSWWPARAIVRTAIANATTIYPSGQIARLSQSGVPWRDHLVSVEEECNAAGRTLYLLFQDTKGNWSIYAAPKSAGSFHSRKALPWKGLRDEALSQASGIADCIFVHVSGFVGGNKTYDGALAMATKALTM